MHLSREGLTTARTVHGTTIARAEVEHVLDQLIEMSPEERLTVPGLNPARADIIVAGLAVAAETMARFEAREVVVSGYGIREGLLLETARVAPLVADTGVARERSVGELAERSHFEELHSRHVQKLALQLFDAIGHRLGCEPADRQILSDAALLHDIGYHINYTKHHKHSYHLIVHADFIGMSPEEQIVVANVARYHRGARPRRKHRNLSSLDKALRARIERLAAILRVADGFDRGHTGAVERIKVRWLRRAIRLTAVPARRASSLRLELWGASRKSELLERVAGTPVEIVAPGGTVVDFDEETGLRGLASGEQPGRDRPEEQGAPGRDALAELEERGAALFHLEESALPIAQQPRRHLAEVGLVTHPGDRLVLVVLAQPVEQRLPLSLG